MGNLHHRWGHKNWDFTAEHVENPWGKPRKMDEKNDGFVSDDFVYPYSTTVLLLWELRLLILDCLFPNISVFCFICWIVSCLIIASLGLVAASPQTNHPFKQLMKQTWHTAVVSCISCSRGALRTIKWIFPIGTGKNLVDGILLLM